MVESILQLIGAKKAAVIGGFFGAVVSIKLLNGMTTWGLITTVLSGWACAIAVSPLVLLYFEMGSDYEYGIAFIVGLFGMSLAAAILSAIRNADIWALVKAKVLGDKSEPSKKEGDN